MKELSQSVSAYDTAFLKYDPESNVLCIDDSYVFLTGNMINYLRSVCDEAEKRVEG